MDSLPPYRTPSAVPALAKAPGALPERYLEPPSRMGFTVSLTGRLLGGMLLLFLLATQGLPPEWMVPAVVVGYVALLAWFVRRRRRLLAVARASDEAVGLLNAGQLGDAARLMDELLPQARGMGLLHALLVYNRACVYLRQSQPQRALELLHRVERSGWFMKGSPHGFDVLLPCTLAVTESVLGDTKRAWAHLEGVRPRMPSLRRGVLFHAELVTGCREGRFREVLAWVDERWRASEGSLTAAQLRLLRLLEAYAAWSVAGADDARVTDALSLARNAEPDEYRYLLAGGWPELEAFLAGHGHGAKVAGAP